MRSFHWLVFLNSLPIVAESVSVPRFTKHSWIAFSALRGAYKHVQVRKFLIAIALFFFFFYQFNKRYSFSITGKAFYFPLLIPLSTNIWKVLIVLFRTFFPFICNRPKYDQLHIEFKPEASSGIILLTGERDDLTGDFLAVLINQRFIEFWYELNLITLLPNW